MKFNISIECKNDTFIENLSYELTSALFKVTRLIENKMIIELHNHPIFDSNGNNVGTIKITKR